MGSLGDDSVGETKYDMSWREFTLEAFPIPIWCLTCSIELSCCIMQVVDTVEEAIDYILRKESI